MQYMMLILQCIIKFLSVYCIVIKQKRLFNP